MPIKQLHNAVQAASFRVKFKDIFNLKEFYKAMHEWMLEYGWSSVESDGLTIEEGDDHYETLYLEKQDAGGAKEMWWWWRLQKLPVSNSYYKWHMDIDSHVLYMLPAEVMREGKKLKVNKGEVEVKIWAYLEFDYLGQWSKHPVLKMFNKIFPNRIFKKELYEDHKLELYREMYTFQAYVKRWFKLRSFLPYEEITPFFPSWAYPAWKKE
ncbi:hypothetical protein KY342_03330 [Candidatus Woesearchaeota archaeon]|nr:hypothetical protein [Candidatus Woesearchaeota archaeon]